MIKIQCYSKKEQQPELSEYFCIHSMVAFPSLLHDTHWLMAKGSWEEEQWVSEKWHFLMKFSALECFFFQKRKLFKNLIWALLFLILKHCGRNHILFTCGNFETSKFVYKNFDIGQWYWEFDIPSAILGRDPGITSPYAKTQDCNIFCTSTQIKYHSLFGMTFW